MRKESVEKVMAGLVALRLEYNAKLWRLLAEAMPDIQLIRAPVVYWARGVAHDMGTEPDGLFLYQADPYGPMAYEGSSVAAVVVKMAKSKPKGAVAAAFWHDMECLPAFTKNNRKYIYAFQIHWITTREAYEALYKQWCIDTKQHERTYEYWYNNVRKPTVKNTLKHWLLKFFGYVK